MRRTLGTAVFSGMLGVTLFGIFITPVFLLRDPVAEGFAAGGAGGGGEWGDAAWECGCEWARRRARVKYDR